MDLHEMGPALEISILEMERLLDSGPSHADEVESKAQHCLHLVRDMKIAMGKGENLKEFWPASEKNLPERVRDVSQKLDVVLKRLRVLSNALKIDQNESSKNGFF